MEDRICNHEIVMLFHSIISQKERWNKLDLLLIPVFDVHREKDAGEDDATDCEDRNYDE